MILGAFVYLLICFVIGLLPTIIAFQRGHESRIAILLLNLFLGWTGIGWIIALIWCAGRTGTSSEKNVIVNNHVFVQGHQSTMEAVLFYAPEPAMQILPPPRAYVPVPATNQGFGRRVS